MTLFICGGDSQSDPFTCAVEFRWSVIESARPRRKLSECERLHCYIRRVLQSFSFGLTFEPNICDSDGVEHHHH